MNTPEQITRSTDASGTPERLSPSVRASCTSGVCSDSPFSLRDHRRRNVKASDFCRRQDTPNAFDHCADAAANFEDVRLRGQLQIAHDPIHPFIGQLIEPFLCAVGTVERVHAIEDQFCKVINLPKLPLPLKIRAPLSCHGCAPPYESDANGKSTRLVCGSANASKAR